MVDSNKRGKITPWQNTELFTLLSGFYIRWNHQSLANSSKPIQKTIAEDILSITLFVTWKRVFQITSRTAVHDCFVRIELFIIHFCSPQSLGKLMQCIQNETNYRRNVFQYWHSGSLISDTRHCLFKRMIDISWWSARYQKLAKFAHLLAVC